MKKRNDEAENTMKRRRRRKRRKKGIKGRSGHTSNTNTRQEKHTEKLQSSECEMQRLNPHDDLFNMVRKDL